MPDAGEARRAAQERADRIRAFRAEADALEREGVLQLDGAAKARVAAHHDSLLTSLADAYDVDVSSGQKKLSLGLRIVSFLGAVALSIAVFLFFQRVWGFLGTTTQVAILVLAPIVAIIGMEAAARRERTLYFTSLLGLVAFALFVVDLSVLATIFNMIPAWSGLVLWAIFGWTLAGRYDLRLVQLAGSVCAIGALAGLVTELAGGWWAAFWQRPEGFFVGGALLLTAVWLKVPRSPMLLAIDRLLGWLSVFLAIFILAASGANSYLPLTHVGIQMVYQIAGFGLGGAVLWWSIRHECPGLVNLASAFLLLFLLQRYWDWCWDWMPHYLFFATLSGIAIGTLLLLRRLRRAPAGRTA